MRAHTDDEGNHGGSVSARLFKTLNELFDLPYLDVLLSLIRLWITHYGGVLMSLAVYGVDWG